MKPLAFRPLLHPAFFVLLALGACASYEGLALPDLPALAGDAARLSVDTESMPTGPMRSHRFDPSDGLDMTEVAMLAVARNPELVALRADAGVTRAQAFSAGLLPDPQLSFGRERALGAPAGATTAFTAGLTFDLGALLARSAVRAASGAESRKTDLQLLWQEWQTVARARLSFVKLTTLDQSIALLDAQRTAVQGRYERTRVAAERGLVTLDVVSPQLAALQDVVRQRNDVERQAKQARHDLNALLGVAPDVVLVLVGPPDVLSLDWEQVQAALSEAPRRRPDLLALQAGYAAEDARYRGALRAQFPAITLGPTRARDTSNVSTAGFSLGLTLPVFNRNRGNIAIEKATRERLRLDYQQRLDATAGDADRLLAEQAILLRQRAAIDASVAELERTAARVGSAFGSQNIDALTLTNVEAATLAKRLERVAVAQALWEQSIAMQALVGGDLIVPDPVELPSP